MDVTDAGVANNNEDSKPQVMVNGYPTTKVLTRQFIKQYYLLLNAAPLHLYKFFQGDDSVFLHEGFDELKKQTGPAVGTQNIRRKIRHLGLHNCYFEVIAVESSGSLPNVVTIMVDGVLSYKGGPKREFQELFVIGIRGPKMFYVKTAVFYGPGRIVNYASDEDDTSLEKSFASSTLAVCGDYDESDTVSEKANYDADGEDEFEEEIPSERATEDLAPEITENPPLFSQELETYSNVVSKNRSSSSPQSLSATSIATSTALTLLPAHKTELQTVCKAEGASTSSRRRNKDDGVCATFDRSRINKPKRKVKLKRKHRFSSKKHRSHTPEDRRNASLRLNKTDDLSVRRYLLLSTSSVRVSRIQSRETMTQRGALSVTLAPQDEAGKQFPLLSPERNFTTIQR